MRWTKLAILALALASPGLAQFGSNAKTLQHLPPCSASVTTNCVVNANGAGNVSVGNRVLPDGTVDVRSQGAVGDERITTDAAMTAASGVLTSATAAFSASDVGKAVIVNAGAKRLRTATYTSGASVTGTVGQNCTVGSFNGGGTGAAAYLILTGSNTVATTQPLDITNIGSGFTSAPTSATLSNGAAVGAGAATCSGTIAISSTLIGAPISTTVASYQSATQITLSTTATTTVTGAYLAIGTDNATAIQAAITAAMTSGGAVYLPGKPSTTTGRYLVASQMALPNNGAGGTNAAQTPLRIFGDGAIFAPFLAATAGVIPSSGSVLDLLYSGTGGKINSQGQGYLELSGLTLMDSNDDTTPFVYCYLTYCYVHDNYIQDNYRKIGGQGTANKQALVMDSSIGYSIDRNEFDRLQTGVYVTDYANSGTIRSNYFTTLCGSDWTGAAVVENQGSGGGGSPSLFGNQVQDNSLEMVGYYWGIWLKGVSGGHFINNTFQDAILGPWVAAGYRIESASPGNQVLDSNYHPQSLYRAVMPLLDDQSGYTSLIYPCKTPTTGTCFEGLGLFNASTSQNSTAQWTFQNYDSTNANSKAQLNFIAGTRQGYINVASGDSMYIGALGSAYLVFQTANTNRLTINPTGDIIPTLPTTCSGHSSGTLWNSSGVVNVCP